MIQKMVQTRLIHTPTEGLCSRMIGDTRIEYDPTVDPWGVKFVFELPGQDMTRWLSLERIGLALAGYGPGPVGEAFISCVHTYIFMTFHSEAGAFTVSMSKAEMVAALYKPYMASEDAGKAFDWDTLAAKLVNHAD